MAGTFALADAVAGDGILSGLVIKGSENFINNTGFALSGASDFLNVAGHVPGVASAGAALVMSVDGVALPILNLAFSGPGTLNNTACGGGVFSCGYDPTGTVFHGSAVGFTTPLPIIPNGAGYTINYTLSVFADPGATIDGGGFGGAAAPEPTSVVLLGWGLAGLALRRHLNSHRR